MKLIATVCLLACSVLFNNGLLANLSVPAIWGDHMVLQQNAEVKIHGWGHPTEKVIITTSWSVDTVRTEVDNHANWSTVLHTPEAGGPHTIKIEGYNTLQIEDVLVGELWLLSGQSNMEWTTGAGIIGGDEAIEKARNNEIRFFEVTNRTADYPTYDVNGHWEVCTPETMPNFSAIGYFFGEKLQDNLKIPVGLISSSWGGTPIETWIPSDSIFNNEELFEASKLLKEYPWAPIDPGVCYNAMIAPLMPLAIAGVLWYQGEANTDNPGSYTNMLSVMVESWRKGFQCDFTFCFAQIAPLAGYEPEAGVKVRDAQRRALSIPNSGMIVLSDIGDTTDIHPKNKIPAGQRFADLVLNKTYGMKEFPASGPLFSDYRVDGKKVIVSFDYNNGLYINGKELTLFELAGVDGVWYPAKAAIKKNQVIVSSSEVKEPVDVRYAWSNPATPKLFNSWGLPTSCFTSK